MKSAPPIGVAYPAFLAVFHLPGLRLAEPIMHVAGVWLREVAWQDWVVLEDSDLAFMLHKDYLRERPIFCAVNLHDFAGDLPQAEGLRDICEENLHVFITALRLHKSGPLIDPSQSTRYLRIKDLNIRAPGLYRHRLFENPFADHYEIRKGDLADVAEIHGDLKVFASAADSDIRIAFRHFNWSYGYGLTAMQRLAFLYIALEATFGAYRFKDRPTPRVSLGTAASVISRSRTPHNIASYLDDPRGGRGLRNYIAHGRTTAPPIPFDDAVPILEETVRDGLRALVRFSLRQVSIADELEDISPGLSTYRHKRAFQELLSHAANGSGKAKTLAQRIAR